MEHFPSRRQQLLSQEQRRPEKSLGVSRKCISSMFWEACIELYCCSIIPLSFVDYSGVRKIWLFFEQLFCYYQSVLVVWNTFGSKFKLSFISWMAFCGNGGKMTLPHLGGLWGETGVRENLFSGRGFSGLARLVHFFTVFAMFAMTTMAHTCTLTPVTQVTSIKAG